jgi:2,4-dienoyl-CoA reductase-like NADH-dependent reductase (Old Yellow Enzyme family)
VVAISDIGRRTYPAAAPRPSPKGTRSTIGRPSHTLPAVTTSLFEPIAFRGGAVAPNRIALAPMTNLQSLPDGRLGPDELAWLALRADGGFGLIETCAAYVASDGQAWPGELGVHDDACLPGLRRLTARLGRAGALGVVQLFHGGVRAPSSVTGRRPWSASEWHEDGPDFEAPRAATEDDLAGAIAGFAAAAARARAAGFGGVELHGAHGYLLGQFLSVAMNRRTDGWGGDLAGRARLLREATRAVRAAAPPPFAVGVRISPEDFGQARGLDLDESLQVARWLADDGVDFVHLSLWKVFEPTRKRPDAHPLPLFREAVPAEVRLLAAGKIWTRDDAERVLGLGADMVSLGRAAIANPDWPRRIADPAWQPRRPPLSSAELAGRGLAPVFARYMRRWKGFVADDA